ncbi:MAG TPA: hypothetical protein VGI26_07995 [Solirubrobacteraceae bacterium]|jgi:hypothetical protein
MSARYVVELGGDPEKRMYVEFTTRVREITDYAVVLTLEQEGEVQTVRLYDGAHAVNEMHRYTRTAGKQPAEVFHHGTLGEGMRAAKAQIKAAYQLMIEGWQAL